MSKGIIVVNMPEKCDNCKMGFVNEYYDQFECYFKPGEEIKSDQGKPDWCPIKEIPVRLEELKYSHSMGDYQRKGFSRGWNACLDEIEGSAEKMKKTQKERLYELFKLIKENPDLPILPMVDSEIVADDVCARWTGSWGSAEITEYIIGDERVYFKDDDDPETVLNNCIGGVDYWEQPEDVVEREFNNLPWVRAIAVNIDLPEV